MVDSCKDFISGLPDDLLYQILSKLSMKEAGSTSLLSKGWRYLFASVPDLDFDDSYSLHPQDKTSFVNFVDRVFELRGEDHVNKFSLQCGDGIFGDEVSSWISKVLSLGVADLALYLSPEIYAPLPPEIFVHEDLVRLSIGPKVGPSCELGHVFLPKLKTLNLESFKFENDEMGFAKLLSGCQVLEELDLRNLRWSDWDSCFVSSKPLKRLILWSESSNNPNSVSFDTPNVVFFAYSDYIAYKYPVLNFDSLVEAHIDIKMTYNQRCDFGYGSDSDEEMDVSGNVKVLLMGICNVETLYISDNTLETLNFCCEAIPIFDKLTHITIDSHNPLVRWKALPEVLKNSPHLETLVFQGLAHRDSDGCEGLCLCRNDSVENHSLSQCSVKFLEIIFGEAYDSDDDESEMETKMKNVKYFLEEMPNLELLTICSDSQPDDHLAVLSSRLQKLEKIASRKGIKIQVIDGEFEQMHL